MKRSADILREHIDLVRGMDEGLLGAAAKVAGGALAGFSGGSLANWFSKKDTTPNKPTSPSSISAPDKPSSNPAASKDPSKPASVGGNPDDIDIGKSDISNAKNLDQNDDRSAASDQVDRLGYSRDDYMPQSIVPVTASVGLPQGGSRYDSALRAVEKKRESAGMPPVSFLNSWNCNGAALGLFTNNRSLGNARDMDQVRQGAGMQPLFTDFGLDVLSENTIGMEPNQFGAGAAVMLVMIKKGSSTPLVYATCMQYVPFQTDKGPGLREMHCVFLGPKSVWDNGGHEQYQSLFSSFKLANGAQELKPKVG